MRKSTIIFGLLVLIIAAFALPTFADDLCNPNIDFEHVGHEQRHAEQYDAALATIDCGLKFDNANYHLWMMRAEVFCHTGRFAESIEAYTQAIALRPNSTYAYNNRGWANFQHGELEAALADLNYALELDKDNAYAYNNRGLVLQLQGEHELAHADFERAIELGLEQPWAAINLYNIEFEMSKLGES